MEYILVKKNIECIDNLLLELKKKVRKSKANSRDFDYVYCQLARLVIQFIECIIRDDKEFNKGYTLDKALLVGNYVHIYKLLLIIDKHIYTNNIEYEVAMDISRKMLELAEIARYLIKHFGEGIIEAYKNKYIKAEEMFEQQVVSDVTESGNIEPIQKRILDSISNKLGTLKLNEEKNTKRFPSIEVIFKDLCDDKLYNICYRTLSHSIHADAMHILSNDIKDKGNNLFAIVFERKVADIRLYNPTLVIVIMAIKDLVHMYDYDFNKESVIKEIDSLCLYVKELENLHENYISNYNMA